MKAHRHEAMVQLAAHPLAWTLVRLARRAGPVVAVPGVGLVVSDAAIARSVLNDEQFTKLGAGGFAEVIAQALGPNALANMDGEAHRALRARLADVVAPGQAAELLEVCQEPLAELGTALSSGRVVDLAAEMRQLSGRVALAMMGVRPESATAADAGSRELLALGARLAGAFRPWRLSGRRLLAARADCERLAALARDGFHAPDAPPSSIVRRLRDLGLSFDEAKGVVAMLFLAGTLTTAASLPRIVALLVDSGQFDALRRGEIAVDQAIDEGLRFVAPVPATVRLARRKAAVGHRTVRAGGRVVILTCNLARDRRLFDDPDRFDARRAHDARSRYLWYGSGPHFCFGFALAQRQLRLVLEALVALPGRLRIVHRRPAWGALIPAYRRLDLRLESSHEAT